MQIELFSPYREAMHLCLCLFSSISRLIKLSHVHMLVLAVGGSARPLAATAQWSGGTSQLRRRDIGIE
jgi:hypothetical protein